MHGMEEDRLEPRQRRGLKSVDLAHDRLHGPVVVSRLEFGGQTVSVVRPAEPDRMLDDPAVREWNRRDDYMPYWAYLWPGALRRPRRSAEPWPAGEAPAVARGDRDRLRRGAGGAGRRWAAACASVSPITTRPPLHFVAALRGKRERVRPDRDRTRLLDWRNPPAETYPRCWAGTCLPAQAVPLVADLLALPCSRLTGWA